MQCPACNTVLPQHAAFCSNCGTALSQTPPPAPPAAAAATAPDFIWSGVLTLATLAGIWSMRWFMWPVYLAGAALALLCGLKPGVAALQRSALFLGAGAIGLLGTVDDLPLLLFGLLLCRGVWGLLTDGRPGQPGFRLSGRRLPAAAAGFALLLIALPFQWHPPVSTAWVSWAQPGTFGNPHGPYSIPTAHTIGFSGESGMVMALFVLPAAGLLYWCREREWPSWVRTALSACFGFMLVGGISALRDYRGIGIMLYWIGMAAVGWSLLAGA